MTRVSLDYNELVVFEEGVFKEMLQQMMSVKLLVGIVNIAGSILYNTFVLYVI